MWEREMLKVGVITVSDSASEGGRESVSDKVVIEMVQKIGGEVLSQSVIPDEEEIISNEIKRLVDELHLDIVVTTGGTGLSPRDVTPEATLKVIEREVPGISEAMRFATFKVSPHAILSRAVAGVRKRSLVINLPGSPKGVRECLGVISFALPHAVEILKGEINRCGG